MSQLYRTRTQFDQHIRQQGGPAEGIHQVQPKNHLHEKIALVQTTSLQHAMYQPLNAENPEEMFGIESAMTFDGLKDPYMRASIIEYIQFMRLTDPLATKPK